MHQIKNAMIYKVQLPAIEAMRGHLAELPFTDLMPTEFAKAGFVNNAVTGELVTPIEGGYSFCIRHDEKILPAAAVKSAVDEKVAQIEQEDGRPVGRKERAQVKEDILLALIVRALSKTVITHCFYSIQDNLLVVSTSSAKMANRIIHMLIKAVGSIKSTTIHISDMKHGVSVRLMGYLDDSIPSAFGGLEVGGEIKLAKKTTGETVQYSGINPVDCGELAANLKNDFEVEHVRLATPMLSFRLNNQFQIKSIAWDYEDNEREDQDDVAHVWRCEASIQLLALSRAVNTLCVALEYKEPEEDKKEGVKA